MAGGTIGDFLRGSLGYADGPALRALDKLAGRKFGLATFLADMEEARAALEPWMPIHYLPLGRWTDDMGLHLRPQDVQQGRLAVVWADADHTFVEIATSIEQLAHLLLLAEEGQANDLDFRPPLEAALAEAARVFGTGFHRVGAYGSFRADAQWRMLIDHFGGSPYAFDLQAVMEDDPERMLEWYRRGIQSEPGCLLMHAGAAKASMALDRAQEAADHVARALACFHHTAYSTDLTEHFELGRSLLGRFRQSFPEDARWMLENEDPRKWVRRSGELFQGGQAQRAEKLLSDTCYGTGDYDAAIPAFRKQYQALGWKWALALCDLRGK